MAEQSKTETLVTRLIAARASKKLTQAQLAEAAHISQSFISQLERGEIDNPGWITVRQIERALGLKPGHLTREVVAGSNH